MSISASARSTFPFNIYLLFKPSAVQPPRHTSSNINCFPSSSDNRAQTRRWTKSQPRLFPLILIDFDLCKWEKPPCAGVIKCGGTNKDVNPLLVIWYKVFYSTRFITAAAESQMNQNVSTPGLNCSIWSESSESFWHNFCNGTHTPVVLCRQLWSILQPDGPDAVWPVRRRTGHEPTHTETGRADQDQTWEYKTGIEHTQNRQNERHQSSLCQK